MGLKNCKQLIRPVLGRKIHCAIKILLVWESRSLKSSCPLQLGKKLYFNLCLLGWQWGRKTTTLCLSMIMAGWVKAVWAISSNSPFLKKNNKKTVLEQRKPLPFICRSPLVADGCLSPLSGGYQSSLDFVPVLAHHQKPHQQQLQHLPWRSDYVQKLVV